MSTSYRRAIFACLITLTGTVFALEYPESKRAAVVDDYFGTKVADPYRWLEDTDSAATRAWVQAQNKLSLPFLAQLPERERIGKRLTELWNYERYGAPEKRAGLYFYTKNDGLQNQPVLYVQKSLTGEPRALLDVNRLAADGTVALTDRRASYDGRWLLYSLAAAGSDWNEFRVRNVETGEDTGDVLQRIKFSSMAWTRDNQGFFYSRYPGVTKAVFEELANQKLYYHRLGTPQSDDTLIYEIPDQPRWLLDGQVTEDGRFLFISVARGASNENLLYYKYLGNPQKPQLDGPVVELVGQWGASYIPIDNEGSVVYLLTDQAAPKKRVAAVDLRAPERKNWFTVVPEEDDVIESAVHAYGQLVLTYMHDAASRIRRYSMDGQLLGEIQLPGLGTVSAVTGYHNDPELFYSYTSFNRPATVYRCDLRSDGCRSWHALALQFSPTDYITRQVFYRSKDGTRVPMFISHKKGLKKDGKTPTHLYGYGGFEIPVTPTFSVSSLAWMEQGGVYAVANLRGGGEYGKAWHEAGILSHKQYVFDDFIAAAEYLVKNGYTAPEHLAISGRSNGGLLVGAVINQRPDLFAAALPSVGVMDMLRFHKFTIGYAWTQDYGSSDDAAGFKTLYAYSPYHNIKPATKHPAVLITTADHDDRVVPGHSFKYAAALQAAQAGDKPVLIRIETKAGHGAGKPTAKLIEEEADKLAFMTNYTK